MSDFHVEVVRLGKIERHPNADTLEWSVVKELSVIFKENQFKEGDKVVFIPADALVPLANPLFSFLSKDDIGREYERIKAKKLRGIYSNGLIVPADPNWEEGQNVQKELGINKWEPKIPLQMMGVNTRDPGILPVFTDLESLRRHPDVLKYGEDVMMTEKIHGSNCRFVFHDDQLWVGGHYSFKKEGENIYWRAAKKYNLLEMLKVVPGVALYGEVFGHQKKFSYGIPFGDLKLVIYDAFSMKTGKYLNVLEFADLRAQIKIDSGYYFPTPPVIYAGPWAKSLKEKRFGQTLIEGATNIREGFVVRPFKEGYEPRVGRRIFKMVSEDYRVMVGQTE